MGDAWLILPRSAALFSSVPSLESLKASSLQTFSIRRSAAEACPQPSLHRHWHLRRPFDHLFGPKARRVTAPLRKVRRRHQSGEEDLGSFVYH